jgi:hypothetical protein
MSELKTLKDFCNIKYVGDVAISEADILCYQLRQEAIKWIKELSKSDNHDHRTCYPDSLCCWCEQDRWKVEFIKHFFNISEDDLK